MGKESCSDDVVADIASVLPHQHPLQLADEATVVAVVRTCNAVSA